MATLFKVFRGYQFVSLKREEVQKCQTNIQNHEDDKIYCPQQL